MKTKYIILEAHTLQEVSELISSRAENEWYLVGPVQVAMAGGGMNEMIHSYVASMKKQSTP